MKHPHAHPEGHSKGHAQPRPLGHLQHPRTDARPIAHPHARPDVHGHAHAAQDQHPHFFLLAPDEVNGMVIRRCLESFGLVTKVAENVDKLLSMLHDGMPTDAILVEPLRHLDALERIREALRKAGKTEDVAIIAVTADAFPASHKKYADRGASAVITLPAGPRELSVGIIAALEAHAHRKRPGHKPEFSAA